ncbi:hypothetical protein IJI55_00065 [Candidatus Saccharibacteria bacterium]|nr:hypothetical protein [Candidatus Saccharibacteria bacterium]
MSEEKKQQEKQEQREQQERQKKLQQAAKLLDKDGNLDVSKYVDRIESEKHRRVMAPIKEAMPWVVGTAVACLVTYAIIAIFSFSKGIICNRAAARELRQNDYVVETDRIEGRTIDFIKIIKDNGGEYVTIIPGKNKIKFSMGEYDVTINGGTVAPRADWDEYETDDLKLSEHPSIYVKRKDDGWLYNAEVNTQESETLRGELVYASNVYFCTTRAGEAMIKFFFSVDTYDAKKKAEETEEYMAEYSSVTTPLLPPED